MKDIVEGMAWIARTCTWELTLRCNLRCGHCGRGPVRAGERDGPGRHAARAARPCRRRMPPRQRSRRRAEPLAALDGVAVEGTRLGMKMNMITNGVDASRELVRRAKDTGVVNLVVSIDGTEQEHDRFRG